MTAGWRAVPLSEVLVPRTGRPSDNDLVSGRMRIISKISFADGRIEFRPGIETKTGLILIHPNDLLVSGINAYKGAIAIYKDEQGLPAAATIHYASYSVCEDRADRQFLWYLLRSDFFRSRLAESVPGGIKTELKPSRLLPVKVPLPPLGEQQHIVQRINALSEAVATTRKIGADSKAEMRALCLSAYETIVQKAPYHPLHMVAPLIRRPIATDLSTTYHELGIRSFGKGTFHKPPIEGVALGDKRLFKIQAGDLLFNIVFAWEGAVAVARREDDGRVGSHRFLTCIPKPNLATAQFLRFHFLTSAGLESLGRASPGGAGRNRTLGLNALASISVPVPPIEQQTWFTEVQAKADEAIQLQDSMDAVIERIIPAVVNQEVARGM